MVTPTTTIAIGVTYAICSSVYFVTAAPTSQTSEHDDGHDDPEAAVSHVGKPRYAG